jgi:hypothetical protein
MTILVAISMVRLHYHSHNPADNVAQVYVLEILATAKFVTILPCVIYAVSNVSTFQIVNDCKSNLLHLAGAH